MPARRRSSHNSEAFDINELDTQDDVHDEFSNEMDVDEPEVYLDDELDFDGDEPVDEDDLDDDEDLDDEEGGEEDDDDDDDIELIRQQHGIPRHLLETMHRGYNDVFMEALHNSTQQPRINSILDGLQSYDPSVILANLSELSTMLLTGNVLTPPISKIDALSLSLVKLLQNSENNEVQIMAARAMTQLIDSEFSVSVKALVTAGLVPVLRQRFENIVYIDLIEQLVHLVNPVASAEPKLVLESGCLLPCLHALDFFGEYVQKQIMSAIELCIREVTNTNVQFAIEHLRAMPSSPSNLMIGSMCSLISAIAKHSNSNVSTVISEQMWQVLLSHIQPNSPQLTKVMKAASHTAARCPQYVHDIGFMANRAVYALVQVEIENYSELELFGKLMNASRERLFACLKLFQVLLPVPLQIPNTVKPGPYRKGKENQRLDKIELSELVDYVRCVVPISIAIYSANLNTAIRQVALLVVLQAVISLKSKNWEELPDMLRHWKILDFVSQVLVESKGNLALAVGALDIIYEVTQVPTMISDLGDSGISGDLKPYLTADETSDVHRTTSRSSNHSSTSSENAASSTESVALLASQTELETVAHSLSRLSMDTIETTTGTYTETSINKLVEGITPRGKIDVQALSAAPLLDLLRAGFLDKLEDSDIESQLAEPFIRLLLSAIRRLENFDLQLTGAKATTITDILSHSIFLRLAPKPGSNSPPTNGSTRSLDTTVSVCVSAFATFKSLEGFLRDSLRGPSRGLARLRRSLEMGNDADNDTSFSNVRFKFYLDNKRVMLNVPVMKAIRSQSQVPTLYYRQVAQDEDNEDEDEDEEFQIVEKSIEGPMKQALNLLKRLAMENERLGVPISWSKFQSIKITAKLTLQLSDILAVTASILPNWTTETVQEYPFLYPLKARMNYVQLNSFSAGRNLRILRQLQQDGGDDADDEFGPEDDDVSRILGRHRRQKFRMSRTALLEGATRMLDQSSKSPAVVEVMFYNEEGTGRGPTQEFFTMASHELSSLDTNMWSSTPGGLFPKPCVNPSADVLKYFRALGMLIARALLDKRVLDFKLNPAFFEAVVGELDLSLRSLGRVEPEMARTLQKVYDSSAENVNAMGLDFTLPGTNTDLIPGGSDMVVTKENRNEYTRLLCDMMLGSGIRHQVDAFIKGFDSTISISELRCFMPDELSIICGSNSDEDWSVETLRNAFTADHGYNMDSAPVVKFLEVLSSFNHDERRQFLKFATGSPNLPVGGFKALVPPFTVVIKHPDNEELSIDSYLPSVMTCANYFKLPSYSSTVIMRERIITAVSEGADAFPLS